MNIRHLRVAASVRDTLRWVDGRNDGSKKLEPTQCKGFATCDNAALMALGTWLGQWPRLARRNAGLPSRRAHPP